MGISDRILPIGANGLLTSPLTSLTLLSILTNHHLLSIPTTHALPTYGTKIPNGQNVPCPPEAEGCKNNICYGLGHPSCSGGISGASPQPLSAFGEDWKSMGFEWTTELCEMDSDGDGVTNGEELGDPCCLWTTLDGDDWNNNNVTVSHPGLATDFLVDYVRPNCGGSSENIFDDGAPATVAYNAYNEGEEQGSFELRIQPYKIPRAETTYVDFVMNLPEDLPGVVHIVWGDALITTPKHTHHFVMMGCTQRIEESKEGMPMDGPPDYCNVPVGGFSGWAPGIVMWNAPVTAGVPIGKDFGIVALTMNVHYTDGHEAEDGEEAVSTDGIRVHYTPDLRKKTLSSIPLIQVGTGPREMVIAPEKERTFMTRTCIVESRCQDIADSIIGALGERLTGMADLTCGKGSAASLCSIPMFAEACPASCGFCEDGSPFVPETYIATDVWYHAHLLGKEMYTTLIPKDDPNARIDLKSAPVWTYEDQSGRSLGEVALRPGDKIQTTCVYDSTSKTKNTQFDLSTYDEMCLNNIVVMVDTPSLDEVSALGAVADIELRAFRCSDTQEGDIWMGEMDSEEDANLVMDNHPLIETDCSFPTMNFRTYLSVPTGEQRCNGDIMEGQHDICSYADEGSFFNPSLDAGFSCNGGTHNDRDSNDGLTEDECVSGGGSWFSYSCSDARSFINSNLDPDLDQTMEYIAEFWYASKCCVGGDAAEEEEEEEKEEEEEEGGLCGDVVGTVLNATAYAGTTCVGGTYAEKDSNDGTTGEQCTEGGGTWAEYDCAGAEGFLATSELDSEILFYLKGMWWAPKCCVEDDGNASIGEDSSSEVNATDATGEPEIDSSLTSSAFRAGSIVVFALVPLSYLLL